MIPILQLRGVSKTFGSGRSEVVALDGVDLTLNRGDCLVLVGSPAPARRR